MTLKIASLYWRLLDGSEEVKLFSLADKAVWERGPELIALEEQYLIPAQKFIFIMPEYNASFPGILKLMIDNTDIKNCWWFKKAMLVGISDGRAGNLRGIEHMTSILHYLKINVLYNKVLLSRVNEEMNSNGELLKPETAEMINTQVEEFLKF